MRHTPRTLSKSFLTINSVIELQSNKKKYILHGFYFLSVFNNVSAHFVSITESKGFQNEHGDINVFHSTVIRPVISMYKL